MIRAEPEKIGASSQWESTLEVPLTDREVLDTALDRFAEHPTADHRRAIVSLFDATVNDVRAANRKPTEPVGFVCAAPQGKAAKLYSPYDRSLEVGTQLYARR